MPKSEGNRSYEQRILLLPMLRSEVVNLLDGLTLYKKDAGDWGRTLRTERQVEKVIQLIHRYGDHPDPQALDAAYSALISIEEWKAMCLKERIGNAASNPKHLVWNAFRGAINARSDIEALLSIMHLKGFGSSQDEETGLRRAKTATAVLRFLNASEWGVVDWRTIAILTQLDNAGWEIDHAVEKAKRLNRNEIRNLFDLVDERMSCEVNQQYRIRRAEPLLPRTADVEMAIFGLSMMAWPFASTGQ